MKDMFARAAMATLLGLGVAAGLIRADDRAAQAPLGLHTPRVIQEQTVPGSGTITATPVTIAPIEGTLAAPSKPRPVKDWMERHNFCCWSHFNNAGCGSFHSDWNFMFGSCRTFFGEPCLRGPLPAPLPAGYGYSQNGCRCP